MSDLRRGDGREKETPLRGKAANSFFGRAESFEKTALVFRDNLIEIKLQPNYSFSQLQTKATNRTWTNGDGLDGWVG